MTTIIYTKVDESPALATYSFLPIIQTFTQDTGINIIQKDISLSGRILANFSDYLSPDQQIPDALAELGELAKTKEANIIKLPNISASIPQLKAAIAELQTQGYAVPDYPESPQNEEESLVQRRYSKVLGSAVNPVLREGNSDRRAPKAVKNYAKKNPHRMGEWDSNSKTHVSHMESGDFLNNEKSATLLGAATVQIRFQNDATGKETVFKNNLNLEAGEIIDATYMDIAALQHFLEAQVQDAKKKDILFSLHMKATMMKVSDPIIFGQAVRIFYKALFEKHGATLDELGVDPNTGLQDLYAKLPNLPEAKQKEILKTIDACYADRPELAMVNSDNGITNLHVPSDVIIDASMPAMIRDSGKMWDKNGERQDAKAVIPDSSYAGIYQAVIDDCKANGAFDPTSMGSISNVGLMAQKAEEYGSHDKTFEAPENGAFVVVDNNENVLLKHRVSKGDIWRMCQVKDAPVRDWVKLAVKRAKATGDPAVFWLNEKRAHDQELIKKVRTYLGLHNTSDIETYIMSPVEATTFSINRARQGLDTISVTGNVLRDYNTDLFPILELGTSAKMLSIVPLMNGGGLFETGAGGSAPKIAKQLFEENHLRWDSLGEFLALSASFDHVASSTNNSKAKVLSETLDQATEALLDNNKSPKRKAGELDNRGSHFYIALYWAQALAAQTQDASLKDRFTGLAEDLANNEATIVAELTDCQGTPADVGGYYRQDDEKAAAVMQPSKTLNSILAKQTVAG